MGLIYDSFLVVNIKPLNINRNEYGILIFIYLRAFLFSLAKRVDSYFIKNHYFCAPCKVNSWLVQIMAEFSFNWTIPLSAPMLF